MTRAEALASTIQRLIAAGVPADEARSEARLLVTAASGARPEELVMRPEAALSEDATATLETLVTRRAQREPLAYLLGERAFFGLTFRVTPAVLIPRPETEFVVEAALAALARVPGRAVDVGTGSGIIAIGIAAHSPDTPVYATDISPSALAIAQENAAHNSVADRVTFLEGDLLAPATAFAPFAVVASNPPYIAPEEIETLEPEVRDWEPRIALGTHTDPLHFYRRLAAEAPPLLAPGGSLIVEVGIGQADDVATLFRAAGLTNVRAIPDYAGIARVVVGEMDVSGHK